MPHDLILIFNYLLRLPCFVLYDVGVLPFELLDKFLDLAFLLPVELLIVHQSYYTFAEFVVGSLLPISESVQCNALISELLELKSLKLFFIKSTSCVVNHKHVLCVLIFFQDFFNTFSKITTPQHDFLQVSVINRKETTRFLCARTVLYLVHGDARYFVKYLPTISQIFDRYDFLFQIKIDLYLACNKNEDLVVILTLLEDLVASLVRLRLHVED